MAITLKPDIEKRLTKALADAIELADVAVTELRVPSIQIAERVYNSEPELMAEASRFWAIERMTRMISHQRRMDPAHLHDQLILADPIFKGLPKRIFLRNGQRPQLMFALLKETEEHLSLLRERYKTNPRVLQFEAVVKMHQKWATKERGVRLIEAMQMEAKERAK